jgi:hypothetical protein
MSIFHLQRSIKKNQYFHVLRQQSLQKSSKFHTLTALKRIKVPFYIGNKLDVW